MVIALDIGTTHVKAVAFNDAGLPLHLAERTNQTLAPYPGWSEQVPESVYQKVLDVLGEVLQFVSQDYPLDQPRAIVFSSAMHGLVAVSKDGNPLSNFILWSDIRAVDEAQALRGQGGGAHALYACTGVPIHPMSPLLKLIWLRKNSPEVFEKTDKFLGIKEYVWYRLTGKMESDWSCASATGLMNIFTNDWDELALATAGISADHLPALVEPKHIAASIPGILPQSCPLIIGASDGALANLGSGATKPGQASLTIGTSAAIRIITDQVLLDDQMRTFCYRLDGTRCIVGGASNNGANALEWLRTSVFRSHLDTAAFANQAFEVPAGADGLKFLPYLQGERAPLWDASARASFTGISAQHTQAHFVRAVMEGVLLNLKVIADILEEKTPIQSIHINGGFARNKLWVSMMRDIFPQKIEVAAPGSDASVRGAFLLGLEALDKAGIDAP